MNNYISIMYKIKYEEVDEYIHNLNLYNISSVIQHIESGEELYLFKYKKQFIDHLKHLLDSGYTYRKFYDRSCVGIEFYGDDISVNFSTNHRLCSLLDLTHETFTSCSIQKIKTFTLKENDDAIEFVKDKILNNKHIEINKQHVDYTNNKLITAIDTSNNDIYVRVKYTICEEEVYRETERLIHSIWYSVGVFKNKTLVLRISIIKDIHKGPRIHAFYF